MSDKEYFLLKELFTFNDLDIKRTYDPDLEYQLYVLRSEQQAYENKLFDEIDYDYEYYRDFPDLKPKLEDDYESESESESESDWW